ncbi:MAG: hypothetical protein KIS87_05765 [Phycisphaeraceae bacterium]|nr:hypothetical protein [Phycisphaeraceae bacterium]
MAGVLKLIDVTTFERSLSTWSLLPRWSIGALAFLVPIVELGLACAWFAGVVRPVVLWLALDFLVAATGLYVSHAIFLEPPECGCLGTLGDYLRIRREVPAIVVRNGILALGIGVGLVVRWRPSPTDKPGPYDA